MNTEEIIRIFQAINRNVSCPQCGLKYRFGNIKIINFENNICFVGLHCGNHPPMLASIALRDDKIVSKVASEVITVDDVLRTYKKLQKIKSIKELFYRRNTRR